MDLLMLSVIVIGILAGLILCLYMLAIKEYWLNLELNRSPDADPIASTSA